MRLPVVPTVAVAAMFALFSATIPSRTGRIAAERAPRDTSSLAALEFMSGCWRGPSGRSNVIEEYYSASSQNIMLGTTRYLRDGRTIDYEFTLIEMDSSGPVMTPHPKGQPAVAFAPLAIGGDSAVWTNPAHDFPQRIVYRRASADSLIARVDGRTSRGDRSIEWRMGRVPCAGAPRTG